MKKSYFRFFVATLLSLSPFFIQGQETDTAYFFWQGKKVNIQEFNSRGGPRSHSISFIDVEGISCFGICDGRATAVVSGGTGPFNFFWVATGATTAAVTNLCAGRYGVIVTDESDGSQVYEEVDIPGATQISILQLSIKPPRCNSYCDAIIDISPVGGTSPYTYSWSSSGQTTQDAINLCAGTYSATVTDAQGCSSTKSFTVSPTPPISPGLTSENVTCFGLCDGTATSTPTGGNAQSTNYTFSWNTGQTSSSISGLCAGTYTVTATDDSLCVGTASVTITEPPLLVLSPSSKNITCGGAQDGRASVGPVTGGTPGYTYSWSPNVSTDSVATNLGPGTYCVTVTDTKSCTKTACFTITEPSLLVANVTAKNVTCFGYCNGTAISTPTGGTSPYSFSWSNGGTNDTIPNLCPGTYTVTVRDANNCTATQSVTITQPVILSANTSSTNLQCFGVCIGTASSAPLGGTSPYTFSWNTSPSQTTSSIDSLCIGTYTLIVTDTLGCKDTATVTITQPTQLTVSVADDTVSCGGTCNGSLTAVVSGGTTGYTFSWSGSQTTPTISGLCAVSSHNVLVQDANGCQSRDTAQVLNPVSISVNPTPTNVTCNGLCNGKIISNPTGGTGPYTYLLNGISQPNNVFNNLCANTAYTITVTDANGCTRTQTVTLTQPAAITSVDNTTHVNCSGRCDGTSALTIGGGTPFPSSPPYSVSWVSLVTNNTVSTGQSADSLCAGAYVAIITDSQGCILRDTITITEPIQVEANGTFTEISCSASNNGTATSSPTGGTTPYDFLWSTGSTNSTISGLDSGIYIITVTDQKGCTDSDTLVLDQPLAVNATINNIAASCGTVCNGSAEAIAGGGTPPYTYSWSTTPSQTTAIATNLCVGSYTVLITDANDCFITLPVQIVPVVQIDINSTGTTPTCFGDCNGQATAVASGGASPYTYSWNTVPSQIESTADSLCAGTYTVTATDVNGCASQKSVTFANPTAITFSTTLIPASCGNICDGSASITSVSGGQSPYTFLWDNDKTTSSITELCAGTYNVTVTDNKGCTKTASVIITSPSTIQPNASIIEATCNNSNGEITLAPSGGVAPYNILWLTGPNAASILNISSNPLSNISAGVYTVEITDNINCIDTFSIILNNINGPSISTVMTPTKCDKSCDGEIAATASGGTGPYTYSWNTTPAQTDSIAENLCQGEYIVTAEDALGCIGSATETVTEPDSIRSNETITDVTCSGFCDGEIALNPSGGIGPYTFAWAGGQTAQTVSGLCADTFGVIITDANLCTTADTFTVKNKTVLQVNLTSANVDCNGTCNGIASTNAFGGTPFNAPGTKPYIYSWSVPGATTSSIIDLCAGSYTVTVFDSVGCSATAPFTITEPAPLAAIITTTDLKCFSECTGSVSASASGGSGDATGIYDYFWTGQGQTSASIFNQCAGNVSLILSDPAAASCSITIPVTITQPPKLNVTASGTSLDCNGVCDGTLTSNATGGTGTLVYSWSPGPVIGSAQAGMCAGDYTITVTDVNNCSDTARVILTQPPAILSNLTSVNPSCNDFCDGSATVVPSGGSPSYNFAWFPGSETTNSVDSLCAGSYSVTITDSKGCTRVQHVTITQPGAIDATMNTTYATCGVCDGTATIFPFGGTGVNYDITWLPNISTNTSATDLCAGLYEVLLVDSFGCGDTVLVPIDNINGPTVTLTTTDAICSGSCDGTAQISITGAGPPFEIEWTSGQTNVDAVSGLCADLYYVSVTDDVGCVSIEPVVINEANPVITNPIVQNISCSGLCDGAIDLNPSGGTSPYTTNWSNGATTEDLSNLCVGTYLVSITDAKGCIGDTTLNVIIPNPLAVNPQSTNVTCNGANNGTARVNISGGTSPYTVAWSTGTTVTTTGVSIISGLPAGTYTANITDANGCTNAQSFTITEPPPLGLTADVKNISCKGACDGSITVTPAGGQFPYTYLWNNGGTGNTLSGICAAGTYSVMVTDANNCNLGPQTYVVTEPTTLNVSITAFNVTCNSECNGAAKANVSGGTSPYLYQWDPSNFTTESVSNLCAGTNTVTITDANGCQASATVNLSEPSAIVANETVVSPPCSGNTGQISLSPSGGAGGPYSISWLNPAGPTDPIISNLAAGIYTVAISDNSGSCSKTFDIPLSNSNGPVVVSTVKDITCSGTCSGSIALTVTGATPPYTYSWSPGGATTDNIDNLCAGIYIAQVIDAVNCITFKKDTIDELPPIEINEVVSNANCGACDGNITLNPTGGVTPYSFIWSNGNTTNSVSGLCAGVHSVEVTDAQGCSVLENINVGNTSGPTTVGVSATPASCFDVDDGSATVTPFGGTAPYSYLWIPGGYTSRTVTGLAAGTYSVEVLDANGCIKIATVTINAPAQILANEIVTNVSACGASDGAITLAPTGGGSGPYTYLWSNAATTETITGLSAGIYEVTITANGCSETVSIALNSSGGPTLTTTKTDVDCNGNCNGTASVTAIGGSGTYGFSWSNGSINNTITGLCPGTYVVQVKDNTTNCASSATVTINEPTPFSFSFPDITGTTCAASCSGSATVLPVGGTLPYTYNWSPSGASTQTASNLCEGVNLVSISDASGCQTSQTILIEESLSLTATISSTNATCGSCNGSASVSPTGGTAPYTFIWSDGSTASSATGLCAGIQSVRITDAAGCSTTLTVNVGNSNGPSVFLNVTDVTCENDNNGSIVSSVNGGTPPYTYLWNPGGQITSSLNGLTAGTYTLEVSDTNGCIGIASATISTQTIINVTPLVTNPPCGATTGSISLMASGGATPYSFAWSNGSTTSNQQNLASGLYTVTVTDAGGACTKTLSIPVSNTSSPALNVSSTDVICYGNCDGTATALSSGNVTWLTSPSQATSVIDSLCPGTYFVQSDSANCTSFNSITITQPDTFHFSIPFIKDLSCGGACDGIGSVMPVGGTLGYTYLWNPGGETNQTPSTLCAGVNSVTITDANGCSASQSITLTEPLELLFDTATILATCTNTADGSINITVTQGRAPFTYLWSNGATTEDLSNVLPGLYTITVADVAGCTKSLDINLGELQQIALSSDSDTAYCEGLGPITLHAAGIGASAWFKLPDTGTTISNLDSVMVDPVVGVTSYLVQVTSGVCTATDTINVSVLPKPVIDAGADVSVLINDPALIGGSPSVQDSVIFTWSPTEGLNDPNIKNPTATLGQTTIYYLTATDSFGCTSMDSVTVTIIPELFIPNGLTLNGDGTNDIWIIDNIELFPNCLVEVYNRWGEVLFSSPGYVTKWDGTYEGKELPVGTYYYIIDLKDEKYKPFTGPITIMR